MLKGEQEGFGDEQDFGRSKGEGRQSAHTNRDGSAFRSQASIMEGGSFVEAIYVYTLWILRRLGSDPKGSKINRRGWVKQELEMPLGEKGENWKTISLSQWWVGMEEYILLHVFISPIEIWEILTGRNQGLRNPRRKLGIGNTGNAGPGNPATNAILDVIEGVVGANSFGEVKKESIQRNVTEELTPPTYGYMGKVEFYTRSVDGNLMNERVSHALRGMIYTEEIGRCMSSDTFICHIPWQGGERICACRCHMRYARGVVLKDGQFEKLAELQIDTIALQRGMLVGENAGINCTKEKMEHNARLIQRTDGRWETSRTSEAGVKKTSD